MALHNSLAHVSHVYYQLSGATGLIVNYLPQPRPQKLEKALGTRLYFNCFPVRRLEAKVNCKESLFCLVRGVFDTKETCEKKKKPHELLGSRPQDFTRSFFLAVSFGVTDDELSKRGTTHSLKRTRSTFQLFSCLPLCKYDALITCLVYIMTVSNY